MKHARKALALLILLVTPLLLSGMIGPVEFADTPLTQTPTKVSLPSYEVVSPIIALNDTAMDYYASLLSWDGDGSPGTPYIIEGYNITSDGKCIQIYDVSYSFEIRDCYISSVTLHAGDGIDIFNATDVLIVDTIVTEKDTSMWLDGIESVEVRNCSIDYTTYGIWIAECVEAIVDSCDVTDVYYSSIAIRWSNNSLVTGCYLEGTESGPGIDLTHTHFVTIYDCEIASCSDSGIYADRSSFLTVENCVIYDNWYVTGPMCGVHLDSSDYATIAGNEIYHNARNGIYVEWSDWVYIFDNEIYDNSDHGIDGIYSNNGTILQNDIHGNGWWPVVVNALCGVYLGASSADWVISGNSIWNNTPSGITLQPAERVEISNNHIFNNTEQGIFALGGEGIAELEIFENEVHHNGYSDVTPWNSAGILVYGYEDISVNHNLVYTNAEYGISVDGDNNRIVGNEVSGSETGIGTEECYFNLISENIVYDCLGGIFVVNVGSNITHNIVYDNMYGIYMDWSGDCLIYGNDVGWNEVNGFERNTFEGEPLVWDDNVSVGNHWHDYDGVGVYDISNDTHVVNADRFPAISLNLSQAAPISFEILETDNVIVWEAYAMNPSHYEVFVDSESVLVEDWDGGNIEYIADGLAHGTHTIGIEVFHISGHSLENGTTAGVEDLTPPEIDGQAHVVITVGDPVSVQFTAVDPSGIASWAVNDTVNFAISSTGLLTNIADLPVGDYVVVITATDIYGNSGFTDVTITVQPATDGGFGTTMILLAGAGGAVVVIVILVVILKKKQT